MALETIQKVNVTSYTKVGELTRAIETWEKVGKATSNPEEKRVAKEQMDKHIQAKSNLVNILTSKFGFLCEESKYKVAQLFKDDGKHKYDNLSIEIMNKYLDHENQIYADEQTLSAEDSLGMKILEGKTGVDYMTVVKSTMAISAVSLLAQGGVFGGIATAISSIMAFNPVVGVCVMALGAASLIKMARKIFAPEIKKLCAQERVRQRFNQIESSSDLQVDMDAYKSEEWAQEAKPSETGKPAPKPKTPEEFAAYRLQIYQKALEAFRKGENFTPPYGDKIITKETMDQLIENARNAAKGKTPKETTEKKEDKAQPTEETTTEKTDKEEKPRSNEEWGAELDKAQKELDNLDKKLQQLKNAMNKAYKEYHVAKTSKKTTDKDLGEKLDKAQRLENNFNELESQYKQKKAVYDAEKAKFDEVTRGKSTKETPAQAENKTGEPKPKEQAETKTEEQKETPAQNANEPLLLKASLAERYKNVASSIDPTKKADGQGKTQDAYNKFIQTYKSILRGLANGITMTMNKNGKGRMYRNAITDAKEQALKAIGNSNQRETYEDLFKSLEELVQETAKTIEKSTDKNKGAEIVQTNLKNAGFTPEEIEEMLK